MALIGELRVNDAFIGTTNDYTNTEKTKLAGIATSAIANVVEDTTPQLGGDLDLNVKNLVSDTTTGSKIGTSKTQKLAFFGETPVVMPANIIDADGNLADITTKFNTLLSQLETLGILDPTAV